MLAKQVLLTSFSNGFLCERILSSSICSEILMTDKFSNKIPRSLTKRWRIHTTCRVTNSGRLYLIVSTFHIPPDVCFLLHLLPLQHCCCLLSKEDGSLPKDFRNEDTSKIQFTVPVSYSLSIWLCLFSSYCLQILSTEHQGRSQDGKKQNKTLSLITAIASKSQPGLRFSSLPALQSNKGLIKAMTIGPFRLFFFKSQPQLTAERN